MKIRGRVMAGLDWKLLILELVIVVYATRCRAGESSTCLTVYNEGGAPAVFLSPKCPRWSLPSYDSGPRTTSIRSARCQVAMLQGRRKSQEDRAVCALDVAIPFPGKSGLKEAMVGIVAVFDGHNGAEASEMASKLLLEYFALHTYFLLDAAFYFVSTGVLPNKGEKDVFQFLNWDKELVPHNLNFERLKFPFPEKADDSFHLDILKEALLRAIHDIDATFSKEARLNNLHAGSTATVVLIVDGLILVANIGDSKALLCSEKFLSPAEAKATLLRLHREQRRNGAVSPIRNYDDSNLATSGGLKHFIVEELTRDHHPGRDDERFRVENAGGYVTEWNGVPRVNGQLAVSRSIGDISFKGYGVISAPEVTDWHPLTTNDSYLVVASDGMFEKLSLQDVCDLLSEVYSYGIKRSGLSSSCSYSLAECLVNTAFKKGSMDNVAAIVVPLEHIGKFPMERCLEEAGIYCSTPEAKEFMPKESASYITPNVVHLGHADRLTTRFDRLLVEGKHGNFGCYYLFENLDDKLDMLQAQNRYQGDYSYDLSHALPESLNDHYGGHLNLYNDQNLCLYVGMAVDGAKDQCVNPESFANFLNFLESIPFHEAVKNNGSTEYGMHNMRYVLKKRFGRGSYGEVWLAFYWSCQKNSNDSSCINSNVESSSYSSAHQCNTSSLDDSLFILKRIMVERGAAVYLSGLREKYFGEVFLNASRCLAGLCDGITTILEEPQLDITEFSEMNESVYFENLSPNKFRLQRAANEEGLNHIVRYVESFESRSNEIWLVFHHEGLSLSKLMYTMEEVESNADEEKAEELKRVQILRPSKWWHWLKTTEAGKEEMRNIIWQLLIALKSCHDRNITHGDIKPENMVICFEDKVTGRCLKGVPTENKNYTTKMRIIDFGSAIDEFTLKHLYGSTGPSRAEQTFEYAPPEAFLNASWYQGLTSTTLKYDMWSVGVVILELILGSPNVFQISALTRALLDPHIEGWNEDFKELAYKLRSLMELCILIPGSNKRHHHKMGQGGVSPASWKCSEEFFSHQIKSRDPLKLGFANIWALRLVRQLLLWHPEDRMNVDDALQHPYFQPPSRN